MSRGVLESMRLHGVLWLTEMDKHPIGTTLTLVGGAPESRAETIADLRRDCLEPITKGMGFWYYDHRIVPDGDWYHKHGWWGNPELMNEIGRLQQLFARCAVQPYQRTADVLVVLDVESSYYCVRNIPDESETLLAVLDAIGHTGVSYDLLYLHDLPKADLKRYRCIIFQDAIHVTAAQRDWIHSHVFCDHRHVVWIYAPGIVGDSDVGTAQMQALTGFSFASVPAAAENDAVFYANAPHAETVRQRSDGTPTVVRCEFGAHTAWYSACPIVEQPVWRRIFRESVHCFVDADDVVLEGSGMVAVYTVSGGTRTICLRNGTVYTDRLAAHSTTVYDAETGKNCWNKCNPLCTASRGSTRSKNCEPFFI